MQFFSAEFIFDGSSFMREDTVLVLNNDNIIEEILFDTNIDDVKHLKGLIMPGLVNAHCHLELSHLKGHINRHSGLVNFLLSVQAKRNTFSQEEVRVAIENAEKEMIQNGIVAVGDLSNTSNTLAQKNKRNIQYHNFIECFGLLDINADERFKSSFDLLNQFAVNHPSSIVLHAPYSISDKLIQLVNEVSQNKITTIHNQECVDENELFIFGTGNFLKLFKAILHDTSFFKPSKKTSLQTYLPKLIHQERIILVHNTFSSNEDVSFANSLKKNLYWCLCPNANIYIENSLPDVDMLMKNQSNIVLGTDSLASNQQLNIFDEILTLQKLLPSISLAEKLKWATSNGAKALGMDQHLGSFDKGKNPGIIQIENMVNKHELPENTQIKMHARHKL
jgi:cytosine/adenosine deaminase-related metal-dependent hydrolase